MPSSLLATRNLGRRITGEWLWNDISMEIAAGDSIALLGPSGSGKTLLMRSISMLDPLDAGDVLWRGQRIESVPKFRSDCIYLQQKPSLVDGTVEDVLRLPFTFRAYADRDFDCQQTLDLLAQLDRDATFLDKQVANLSGGEAQITSILRALQLQPTVLLLDEQTSALDKLAALAVEALLQSWLAEPNRERAYVWVSHDIEQAHRVAETGWTIVDGAIKVQGIDA